ncbi:dihydrolipoyl dehydrogenase [Patescibacteria group bacterium]
MDQPKKFDVIVIGSGAGLAISSYAAQINLKAAVVEEGPMGGTCLNRGCIPSKLLIHHADVANIIREADKFNIKAELKEIDFPAIVDYVSKYVDEDSAKIEKGNINNPNITLYKKRGSFVDNKILKVGDQLITSDKIVIAAGARPNIPPIEGLKDAPYMTSKEALRLTTLPKKLIVIGGGYISAELTHYFGSLGSQTTIFQRGPVLVANEDEEIAQTFTEVFSRRHNVLTNWAVKKVSHDGKEFTVTAQSKDDRDITEKADQLLVALGVKPNSDTLAVEKAGIKINDRGYIEVNEYLETSVSGIWAFGDIIGRNLFRHSANWEANFVVQNIFGREKLAVDYTAMPHAVFSSPQIAGVGATEQELKNKGMKYQVGKYLYTNTAMGAALKEEDGYVKMITDESGQKILGCHIIGAEASTLIHEVLVAIKAANGNVSAIKNTVHIHPALSEVVQRAFRQISPK